MSTCVEYLCTSSLRVLIAVRLNSSQRSRGGVRINMSVKCNSALSNSEDWRCGLLNFIYDLLMVRNLTFYPHLSF